MRTLYILCLLPLALLGQAGSASDKPPASPVPAGEDWLNGYAEVGYRTHSGIGGSEATYRSTVNLGEGLKLSATDFTILDPKKRLFERVRVRASDWGGDPWSSLHIFTEKRGIYKFLANYRNLTYFNNLPSYADPTVGKGVFLNQQAFDSRRRAGSYDLELLNGRMISPYVVYDRDSSRGTGVSVFRTDGNEYAVPELTRDTTDLYRAGAHVSFHNMHVTVEQGASIFRSDLTTSVSGTSSNPGNNTTPVLGQSLTLSSLLRTTGVRGNGAFSRVTGTASPFTWLALSGNYMYANPHNDVNFRQTATGNFVVLSEALFYTTGQAVLKSTANLPHLAGNFGWQIHPGQRFRITQAWTTDRINSRANSVTLERLALAGNWTLGNSNSALDSRESRLETNVFVEGPARITLRGGHRYVWGDASGAILPAAGLTVAPFAVLRRQVELAGITWRPATRFSAAADAEVGKGSGAWFRTSLYDYRKVRATGNAKVMSSLTLSLDYRTLHNQNPYSGTSYRFDLNQVAASLSWIPKGDRANLQATWEHCSYNSAISYLQPQILQTSISGYRESCHTISGLLSANLKGFVKGDTVRLTAGGSSVMTTGSRPVDYFQPTARVNVPVTKRVALFAEWRYYGLNETLYMYEAFRTHIVTTGLRFSR